jgi:hypothetical protein
MIHGDECFGMKIARNSCVFITPERNIDETSNINHTEKIRGTNANQNENENENHFPQ